MIELPSLTEARLVRLSRQGGLAYLPARAAPREFDLQACPEATRRELCMALQQAATHATVEDAAGGDQRHFRIEIWFMEEAPSVRFQVPEHGAPEALVRLWKGGGA